MDSDSPERIWAFPKKDWFSAGASTHRIIGAGARDVEYVRGDLFAALEERVKALEAIKAENERLRDALRPLCSGCFNDNGDLTVSAPPITTDDVRRAYFALSSEADATQ